MFFAWRFDQHQKAKYLPIGGSLVTFFFKQQVRRAHFKVLISAAFVLTTVFNLKSFAFGFCDCKLHYLPSAVLGGSVNF